MQRAFQAQSTPLRSLLIRENLAYPVDSRTRMKLPDWASIAEIASSIAVVTTLILLISGIKENTAITRATMFDTTMRGLAEFRTLIISDPEVARLWDAFRSGQADALSGPDRTRIRQLLILTYEAQQRAYYARKYGVLGESEWNRFENQICGQYPRVKASQNITGGLRAVLTPEFWGYMQETCDSVTSAPGAAD
jgi:hypothetical protein